MAGISSVRRIGAALILLLIPTLGAAKPAAAEGEFPLTFVPVEKRAAAAAAAEDTRFRIYNGDIATEGAWPWQVGLLNNIDDTILNRQFCGGSLISRSWVLTAAHCVFEEQDNGKGVVTDPGSISILVGTNYLLDGEGEVIPVARIFAHPDYDPLLTDNDIALIALAHPPTARGLVPIQLATPDLEAQIAAAGTEAVVIGWGKLESGKFPVDLRQATVEIFNSAECNKSLIDARAGEAKAFLDEIKDFLGVPDDAAERAWELLLAAAEGPMTQNMICSGYRDTPRGSCNADSGGPLMVKLPDGAYVQVGIVSWGNIGENDVGCETEGHYAAYTRVANYADWIRSVQIGGANRR